MPFTIRPYRRFPVPCFLLNYQAEEEIRNVHRKMGNS